jgi:NADH-quinone oxidoreductase subunit H
MTAQLIVSVIVVLVVIHLVLVTVGISLYLERKISAYMQDRLGPNRVGFDLGLPLLKKLFRGFGFWGLGQSLADGIKMLLKEDYTPPRADKALFTLAPAAIVIPALIGWAVIPWGGYIELPDFSLPFFGTIEGGRTLVAAADVNVGVIYLLAIASLGVYGVTLGGWASNNKFSFFGGLRATAGMISYEIPLGLAVLAILLTAGTVHPQRIIEAQVEGGWYILAHPLAGLLFFVCILAEANRAPFDNAEAEQELVAGYHTEYSSMRFGLFFLGEYAHMITSSAFLAVLFFGGYHLPFIPALSPEATGIGAAIAKFLVLFGKTMLSVVFMMVVRWTLPRIRWDQVMKLAWNDLIPIGIVLIVATSGFVMQGWTAWWQMLLMNVIVIGAGLAVAPLLPKTDLNRRVPLEGSRFAPLPGEQVITGPPSEQAADAQAPRPAAA